MEHPAPRDLDAPNRNLAFAGALLQELARSGVRHVCVSPGSRSAPLAIAAGSERDLRIFTPIDERAAGFLALGLARASRAPVALVCTSGSAAANLHPAVVEASLAGVPLLLLTADRPPEARGWGAGQAIDQLHLFGSHVRWFVDVAPPEPGEAALRHARVLACRAVAVARATPPGPVHLNLAFREPLDPRRVEADALAAGPARGVGRTGRREGPYTVVSHSVATPSPETVACLAERMERCERGIVACGPLDATPDLAFGVGDLARRLGWPLVAEPASQLRGAAHASGAPLFSSADLVLRDSRFAERHRPDFVLRFGATPTSKAFRLWLESQPPEELVLVDPGGGWNEPSHLASQVVWADERVLCSLLEHRLGERPRRSPWLDAFLTAESRARAAIDAALPPDALLEPCVVREVAAALPEGAQLYVASSMPIRDVDAYWPADGPAVRVLCNRGANGIDGLVASAAGAALAEGRPTLLLCGDLAFLHDLSGSLLAAREQAPLVALVLDNDGGGIFSHLPVAGFGEAVRFESLFRTPHGRALAPLAAGLGGRGLRIDGISHLGAALKDALARPGFDVLVAPTDRDANVALRREVARAVGDAVAGGPIAGGDPEGR